MDFVYLKMFSRLVVETGHLTFDKLAPDQWTRLRLINPTNTSLSRVSSSHSNVGLYHELGEKES